MGLRGQSSDDYDYDYVSSAEKCVTYFLLRSSPGTNVSEEIQRGATVFTSRVTISCRVKKRRTEFISVKTIVQTIVREVIDPDHKSGQTIFDGCQNMLI